MTAMMTPILSKDGVRRAQAALGVAFADPELLKRAFAHRSFVSEFPGALDESNERLEFLGDAALGLIVAQALAARFPERREGGLTQTRAALVDKAALAAVAARLGLGGWLALGKGEAERGGAKRESNLADAFEALVGALFADGGYETAREFVLRAMSAELESAASAQSPPRHPKSLLHEAAMRRRLSPPEYRIVERTGPDHAPAFTAEAIIGGEPAGAGEGGSKREAESAAAQAALDGLADISRE